MEKITQMVGFTVGAGSFALPIAAVREIVRLPAITPVPHLAAEVEGVMNLRGQVLPVVSMRRCLKLTADPVLPTQSEKVIVVEVNGRRIGLHVDGGAEILRPSGPAEACGARWQQVSHSQIKLDGHAIVLLDLKRLLERIGAHA